MNDTQVKIAALLSTWNIQFSASLIGETIKDNNWECDEWRVKLGTIETHYYTGTGCRKPKPGAFRTTARKGTVAYANWERANLQPVAPCAVDVIYSLLSDAEAADMSFNDWCDNFGYSSDSISAFDTYQQCCAIGQDLRKVFTAEQRARLSELLQDY